VEVVEEVRSAETWCCCFFYFIKLPRFRYELFVSRRKQLNLHHSSSSSFLFIIINLHSLTLCCSKISLLLSILTGGSRSSGRSLDEAFVIPLTANELPSSDDNNNSGSSALMLAMLENDKSNTQSQFRASTTGGRQRSKTVDDVGNGSVSFGGSTTYGLNATMPARVGSPTKSVLRVPSRGGGGGGGGLNGATTLRTMESTTSSFDVPPSRDQQQQQQQYQQHHHHHEQQQRGSTTGDGSTGSDFVKKLEERRLRAESEREAKFNGGISSRKNNSGGGRKKLSSTYLLSGSVYLGSGLGIRKESSYPDKKDLLRSRSSDR
jgi:hypothetical protein